MSKSIFKTGSTVVVYLDKVQKTFNYATEEDAAERYKMFLSLSEKELNKKLKEGDRVSLDPYGYFEKDFENNLYYKGRKIDVGMKFRERIEELCDSEEDFPREAFQPYANFLDHLLSNPSIEVQKALFNFADHFHFPITSKGYFIGYKAVRMRSTEYRYVLQSFGSMVTENHVKHKMPKHTMPKVFIRADYDEYGRPRLELPKSISDYKFDLDQETLERKTHTVWVTLTKKEAIEAEKNGEHVQVVGNLKKKYEVLRTLPSYIYVGTLEQVFNTLWKEVDTAASQMTDLHSGTTEINLGQPVTMEREDCNADPHVSCSTGLHVGTPDYVNDFKNSDSIVLACLVSPYNVVSVPYDYNAQKLRTCEYLPYGIVELDDEGKIVEIDIHSFEEEYAKVEIEELSKKITALSKDVELGQIDGNSDKYKSLMKSYKSRLQVLS